MGGFDHPTRPVVPASEVVGYHLEAVAIATRARKALPVIGWREWVSLPDLGVPALKAKVDTGARTSALHAFDLEIDETSAGAVARFEIHPDQQGANGAIAVEWPILTWRKVRSSNGDVEERPVIRTALELGGKRWPVDVTLTNRDEMGFRMLLGRAAIRRRFVVDSGRSFLTSG